MKIEKSKNLKVFKKEIGQANHFLITILVGLDGIKNGDIDLNEEFRTSWNPKDRGVSAERSRAFAKKSTLAWIVDNIDMYFSMGNEEPKIMRDELIIRIDKNGRSVYKKFLSIIEYYNINDIDSAFVDLIICWRNRLMHYKADNDILSKSRDILKRENEISNYNLDINRMIENFDNFKEPSFKEVATMVRASINFIEKLDSLLLKEMDSVKYADKIIYYYIKENDIKRLDNLFSKDENSRERMIKRILSDNGFNDKIDTSIDNYIEKVKSYKFNQAKEKYKEKSFV